MDVKIQQTAICIYTALRTSGPKAIKLFAGLELTELATNIEEVGRQEEILYIQGRIL